MNGRHFSFTIHPTSCSKIVSSMFFHESYVWLTQAMRGAVSKLEAIGSLFIKINLQRLFSFSWYLLIHLELLLSIHQSSFYLEFQSKYLCDLMTPGKLRLMPTFWFKFYLIYICTHFIPCPSIKIDNIFHTSDFLESWPGLTLFLLPSKGRNSGFLGDWGAYILHWKCTSKVLALLQICRILGSEINIYSHF